MNRRQVEIPDKLYHITKLEYVPEILAYGLIPNKNKVGIFTDDCRLGVFLTSDWKAVLESDCALRLEDELALLEVDVSEFKDKLIVDDSYDFGDEEWRELFTAEDLENGLYDQFSWYIDTIIPTRCIYCLGVEILNKQHSRLGV